MGDEEAAMAAAAAEPHEEATPHQEIEAVATESPPPQTTPEEEDEEAAVDASEAASVHEKTQPRKWWPFILLALAVVGLAVGLGVGLGTKDNNNSAEAAEAKDERVDRPKEGTAPADGEDSITPAPSPTIEGWEGFDIPEDGTTGTADAFADPYADMELGKVEVDRSCDFVPGQTVVVSAPDTGVEKKLTGGASAFDGDHAVIVSYNSDGTAGAVWALTGQSNSNLGTIYSQSGVLQTPDADQLGWDVSVKGDTFVAGAPGQDGRDIALIEGWYWAGRGKAVVMERKDGAWVETAVLEPSVAEDNADFGSSVSVADCGCLIAVGAWHDRDSRGSVFVYAKNDDGTWSELQRIAPADTRRTQSDHLHGNFGYTVAITDEYLAIKAPYDSYGNSDEWYDPNRGVVYGYKRGSDGTFQRINRLYAPEGRQVRAHLTGMVFLDDFLLVGAPGRNRVYVFEEYEGGYRKSAELVPSDDMGDDDNDFGISVDGNGASVVVGDRTGGASYLFAYEDGVWKEKAKFDGFNVALSGDAIVQHTPGSFEAGDGRYGGEVNFYDIVC